MSILCTVLLTLGLCYFGLILFALFVSDSLIFRPPRPAQYTDNETLTKLETKSGEQISALYIQSENAKQTILFSHGNAEDIANRIQWMETFIKRGFSVIIYDYPGYGISTGEPSESGSYEAIDSVYDYLTQIQKLDPKSIILYGHSLGGGPSIDLASRKPVSGLIVKGTFVSTFRVMTKYPLVPWDKFNNLAKIDKIHCPKLFIHGTEDKTVPFWHGQTLYRRANAPKEKLWAKGAGHNNLVEHSEKAYWDAILTFAQSLQK